MAVKNEQITRIMNGLKCSEQEAQEIYEYDCAIDKAKVKDRLEYDISLEAEKIAQKFAHTGTKKPTIYQFNKRERKENATKAGIIAEIAKFLEEMSDFATESVEITNKERQIAFKIGENAFEITLVQKRKPKS